MRTVVDATGMSLTSIWRVLNKNKFHLYYYKLVKELQ